MTCTSATQKSAQSIYSGLTPLIIQQLCMLYLSSSTILVTENFMGGTISLSEVSHVNKAEDEIRDTGYKSNLIG